MIHMELGPSTIVGVGLALIGFILYLIKTKKPDVSRDYDLFFSSVGLLCGGILIFQGWRLDPILLLCQILSSATAIFFIGESLWLRGTKSKNKNFFASGYRISKKKNALQAPLEISLSENQKTNEIFLPSLHRRQCRWSPKGEVLTESLRPQGPTCRSIGVWEEDHRQDFFNTKSFFSDQESEILELIKKKTFTPSEIQRVKNITEMNSQYLFNTKKRRPLSHPLTFPRRRCVSRGRRWPPGTFREVYDEKKISMYYQLKKIDIDLDYTHPIDYCHITFSTKD